MGIGMEVVELIDLDYWEYYDFNLGDDAVIAADITEATPTNVLFPYPANVDPLSWELEIKQIRVTHGDGNAGFCDEVFNIEASEGASPDGGASTYAARGHWDLGFFKFDETTENAEAYRDEQFESIWSQRFGLIKCTTVSDTDIVNFGSVGPYAYGLDTLLVFKKDNPRRGRRFPLNPSFKIFVQNDASSNANVLLEKEDWKVRIWYRLRKRSDDTLARVLALNIQSLSA
jgi:hypothetical protein